jgi:phage shock protein PspC (stress-responsive transcriptional regulator)
LAIDPIWVRIVFVLLALSGGGLGVLIYIVLWLVIPREGAGQAATTETVRSGTEEIAERARAMGEEVRERLVQPEPRLVALIGLALVVFGAVFLLREFDLAWARWLDFDVLWPAVLVVLGIVLIVRHFRGE